jgi:hypothetical protein
MKALAAVRIRQYEKAVESLGDYNETVEMALRVIFLNRPQIMLGARPGQEIDWAQSCSDPTTHVRTAQ